MALKAIQFGAGNIGRGFTAQLFTESGYEVVFVDVVDEIVRLINERRSYPIEIVGDSPHGPAALMPPTNQRDRVLLCRILGQVFAVGAEIIAVG